MQRDYVTDRNASRFLSPALASRIMYPRVSREDMETAGKIIAAIRHDRKANYILAGIVEMLLHGKVPALAESINNR